MSSSALTRVLLVEDNPADARLITEQLTEQPWPDIEADTPTVDYVDRLSSVRDALTDDVDVVLLDLGLPDSAGVETLDELLAIDVPTPVVVMTGLDDTQVGVDAVERAGPARRQRAARYAIRREQQQQQLRQRNAELALVNQIVRHDIRNDVAVILGWGDALKAHVDEEGRAHLDRMLSAGEHITDITDTVGEFINALKESDEPELRPVDLASVLTNEIEKTRAAHGEATITVTGDLRDGVGVVATDLLSSVFRNLLTNAVTHNDKPEPEITVTVTEAGDTVSVAIADNGPGIPDRQKDEIFTRGETGAEGSSSSPSSGLGLYLVDVLVEMYNGSVTVTDNDPAGSVFTVVLETQPPSHPDRPV